ncbi:MAG: hypothetical protein ABIH18_07990 [Candidatus Omnitrophota bacterium]
MSVLEMPKLKANRFLKYIILFLFAGIILIKIDTLYAVSEGIRYYFKEKSFSIEIPRDWRARQPSESEMDFILSKNKGSPKAYGISIIVNIMPFSREPDLKNYLEEFLSRSKPNLSPVSYRKQKNFIIDRTAAKRVYFTYGNNRFLTSIVIKGKYVYIIECFTIIKEFNNYKAVFEKIIKSIEFI